MAVDRETISEEILKDLALGMSLVKACEKPGRVSQTAFYKWLDESPELVEKYARAREKQAETHADAIVDIADTEQDAAKARNRIDARKWAASKLAPKKYGDRVTQEHVGKDDGPIQVTDETRARALAAFLARTGAK